MYSQHIRFLSKLPYGTFEIVSLICTGLVASLAGCAKTEPFQYVQVSGQVCYEDGTLLPVKTLSLNFHPQVAAKDKNTHPRVGSATVDVRTGTFGSVTSHRQDDGLVKGKHKVTLHLPGRMPLPPDISSETYSSVESTPLEVDTSTVPFDLRVAKPTTSSGSK